MKTTESGQMNQNTELVKRLDELIALSEEATPGEWIVEMGDGYITGHIISPEHKYAGNTASRTDSITDSNSMTNRDATFIAALVNWFRANALTISTQERVIVELRKALDQVSDMLEDAYVGCEDAAKAYGITKIVKKVRALSRSVHYARKTK